MDIIGIDRNGEEIKDSTRLFQLPVKNNIRNLRSLKVYVKIMITKLIQSYFFDSFGLIHKCNTDSVLIRNGRDSNILGKLASELKRDKETKTCEFDQNGRER